MDLPILYAMRASLYSAKARSFLIKQGIDHIELPTGDPRYAAEVVPGIGRMIMPVVQLPDGRLIQDTVDIIDHFDSTLEPERSARPADGVLSVLAHVLELFGGEGLMRAAMHYRWNFDEVCLPFIEKDFGHSFIVPLDPEAGSEAPEIAKARAQVFQLASELMRKATLRFGVTEETIPDVEASYVEFLSLFDAHLEKFPYLLGGRPTLGDFAFMGPLYAHLGRDPQPSMVMKLNARQVWRWTERMMSPVADTGEYPAVTADLFPADAIPESLTALLAYFATESLPEIVATIGFVDRYLEENPEVGEGDIVGGKPSRRSIGLMPMIWRGHEVEINVLPYRLTLLQRIQEAHSALDPATAQQARDVLAAAGLDPLLGLKARRSVVRANNIELWGPEQPTFLAA